MQRKKRKTVLWIDDRIHKLQPYVQALTEAAFDVACASSSRAAMVAARARRFDIILIDIRMPHPDGIELIRQLHPLQPKAIYAVVSSYLYLEMYKKRLRQLPFSVELIDKDMTNVDSPDFIPRFIDPIKQLAKSGVTKTIVAQDEEVKKASQLDPFEIPLAEYMQMSIPEKDRLKEEAYETAKKTIEHCFNEGNIWLFLCGSKDIICASASKQEQILSVDETMEIARTENRAPFRFWSDLEIDDIWLGCGWKSSLQDYTTVTLELEDVTHSVHFDTGSPMTFFSYEELRELGMIKPTNDFDRSARRGEPYYLVQLKLQVLLKCQRTGEKKSVILNGQAVRGWTDSPFARSCDETCPNEGNLRNGDGRRICPQRIGLIGRNLLTDNSLVLTLDGIQKKTILGRP